MDLADLGLRTPSYPANTGRDENPLVGFRKEIGLADKLSKNQLGTTLNHGVDWFNDPKLLL
jgi:hypothetical protein